MTNPPPSPDIPISVRALRPAHGGPLRNFDLRPGTAVYLEESAEALPPGAPRWLDLLLGLEIPDPDEAGTVFWHGCPWASLPPDEAAAARGECGVVPAGGGLLTNLDMDENVWLPILWHRREEAGADIAEWAAFFACSPLPQERAHAVSTVLRRRIAWTRAFSGNPSVLVLEDSADGTSSADHKLLLEACRRKLSEGSAIAWIAPELDPDVAAVLKPTSAVSPGIPETQT